MSLSSYSIQGRDFSLRPQIRSTCGIPYDTPKVFSTVGLPGSHCSHPTFAMPTSGFSSPSRDGLSSPSSVPSPSKSPALSLVSNDMDGASFEELMKERTRVSAAQRNFKALRHSRQLTTEDTIVCCFFICVCVGVWCFWCRFGKNERSTVLRSCVFASPNWSRPWRRRFVVGSMSRRGWTGWRPRRLRGWRSACRKRSGTSPRPCRPVSSTWRTGCPGWNNPLTRMPSSSWTPSRPRAGSSGRLWKACGTTWRRKRKRDSAGRGRLLRQLELHSKQFYGQVRKRIGGTDRGHGRPRSGHQGQGGRPAPTTGRMAQTNPNRTRRTRRRPPTRSRRTTSARRRNRPSTQQLHP